MFSQKGIEINLNLGTLVTYEQRIELSLDRIYNNIFSVEYGMIGKESNMDYLLIRIL